MSLRLLCFFSFFTRPTEPSACVRVFTGPVETNAPPNAGPPKWALFQYTPLKERNPYFFLPFLALAGAVTATEFLA